MRTMVGRSPASLFSRTEHDVGETLMQVRDVTLPRLGGGFLLDHISFDVHAGEILGLYGLMGAGRTELMEVLAGVRPEASGEVVLEGRDLMDATVSRLRPVVLAAATTVLGVAPLLPDVFWVAMAVTIMFGLAFGTVLTMILLPVLYACLYRIRPDTP